MIENGADPDQTPNIQVDPDAYSVWSDMKSTPGVPSTVNGRIEDGKIIYPGASTISIQGPKTTTDTISLLSDHEVPELNTDDFNDIQFEQNLPSEAAVLDQDHDGSNNSYQRK